MVRLFLLLFMACISITAHAAIHAALDRSSIYENETVTLNITMDEVKFFSRAEPDISVLEKNFSISGQHKSSQTQYINGQRSAQTQWQYVLTPKQAGVVSIPPITVGKEKTQALSLHVKTVDNPSGLSTDPVFIEVDVDKKQAFVQEQILLTIKVNYAVSLSNIEVSPLQLDNARVLSAEDSEYARTINGQHYNTYQISYAIFPQQSGELVIPAIPVHAIIPRTRMDMMTRQGQRQRLQSQAITIEVKAANAQQRLVAEQFSLQESWSADPQSLKVGDSITRRIRQEANGLLAEQLGDIPLEKPQHVRIYSEQPQFENHTTAQGNTGSRLDSYAMVLTEPGTITLPAIRIPWWNSQTQQAEVASLPAVTLQVQGDASSTAHSTQAPTATTTSPTEAIVEEAQSIAENLQDTVVPLALRWWQLATFICALLAAIFAWLLLRNGQQQKEATYTPVEGAQLAWQALEKTCRSQNAYNIREALLLWAKMTWSEKTIHSLADIKRVIDAPAIHQWLDTLDAHLFKGVETKENWREFAALLKQHTANKKAAQPSIYPTR